jgi:hypothetical protein
LPGWPAGAWYKAGSCKAGTPSKKTTPWIQGEWAELQGEDYCHSIPWSVIEPEPDKWDWKAVDKAIQEVADRGFLVETSVSTGDLAPSWLYGSKFGVEKIKIDGTKCGTTKERVWPNYLNKKYQERYLNMQRQFAAHIASMPYASSLATIEIKYGTTGDRGPWHGSATSNKELAKKVKKEFDSGYVNVVTPQVCEAYKAHGLRPRWNGNSAERLSYCPDSTIKAGMLGQGMQLNQETEDQGGDWSVGNMSSVCYRQGVHCESEFNGGSYALDYYGNPGMYLFFMYWITAGLSNSGQKGSQICDTEMEPYYDFFNTWAMSNRLPVDDALTPGGILFFRDGLDAADTKRFPKSKYGSSDSDRVDAVAKAFKDRGAKIEDEKAAKGDRWDSRKRKKENDVGLKIWAGNYGNFRMTQLCPDTRSTSWWRPAAVDAPHDMPQGRWSRSFGSSPRMGFTLGSELWGGKPTGKQLQFRVTYLDKGTDGWELHYAGAGGCSKLLSVKKRNTGKWREVTALADDAKFDGSCDAPQDCNGVGADVTLVNADGKDDVFHSLEVARADQVKSCNGFPGVTCDGAQLVEV